MLISKRVLLWLLFGLTFASLLGVGYTTNDETHVYFFFKYSWGGFPFEILSSFRLYFLQFFISLRPSLSLLVTGPFLSLISGTYHYPLAMRVVSILGHALNLYLFHRILKRTFASAGIADLGAVFFLAFIQNSWDHNLLTSYVPHLYCFSLVLLSFVFFCEYLDTRRQGHLAASAALYFLSLSYETSLVYAPLFLVLAFCRERSQTTVGIASCWREALRHCRYTATLTVAWLIVYLLMRRWNERIAASLLAAAQSTNPESQVGYAFSIGWKSFRRILDVVFCHGISAFPGFVLAYYRGFMNQYSLSFSQFHPAPIVLLRNIQIAWLLRAAIVAFMTQRLLRSLRKGEARLVNVFPGILVGFYLIFAPGVPVSLVGKYQAWVLGGTLGFINTYHSLFGVVFISLVIGVHLITDAAESLRRDLYRIFKAAAIAVMTLLAFCVSVATDYSNSAFALSQTQSNYKWKCVDLFLDTPEFRSLPSGSVIYAPSLFGQIGIMKIFPTYWTDYIAYKAGETRNVLAEPGLQSASIRDPRVIFGAPGKGIRIVESLQDLEKAGELRNSGKLFCLKYAQEKKDSNQFIVFAKAKRVAPDERRWDCISDEVVVYTHSKYRDFVIYGAAEVPLGSRGLAVDGVPQLMSKNSFFSLHVRKDDVRVSPIRTLVRGKGISVGALSISNYVDVEPLSP